MTLVQQEIGISAKQNPRRVHKEAGGSERRLMEMCDWLIHTCRERHHTGNEREKERDPQIDMFQ